MVQEMGQTDGLTDGGKFNSPPSSLCEAGDKKRKLMFDLLLKLDTFIKVIYGKDL